jgi:hypothetical protein
MVRLLVDPNQVQSSSEFRDILSPVALRRLQSSWQFLFRRAILELMPADALAAHFHVVMGRPTKELYSVAGLLLIKEFMNWINERAADSYMFDVSVQYALNLKPHQQSMCERTVERYNKLFREDELASQIMQQVTVKLVELLELDVSRQRLDSTHVQSNMATFGRTRLMGVAIKGFLSPLRRIEEAAYLELPEDLRNRYEPSRNQLFGSWKKDEDWSIHRLTVAQEMYSLVARFAKHETISTMPWYQTMVVVFEQQCEVKLDKVEVRKSPGGDIVVNPSDPDATLDGHKGSGYQVQLSETCSPVNQTQLIVAAIPEQAHQSDSNAMKKVLVDLQKNDLLPAQMVADTAYGGDDNFCLCQRYGVELEAPVPGKCSEQKASSEVFSETDFPFEEREVIDGYGKKHINPIITSCPAGKTPHRSHYHHGIGKMETLHFTETCQECPLQSKCPVRYSNGWMVVTIHAKPLRLSQRRQKQETEEFKINYRRRSGIEATNSLLKRVTGLGRLRVRGKASVFQSLLLKVAGWNILRAASSKRLMSSLRAILAAMIGWIKHLASRQRIGAISPR